MAWKNFSGRIKVVLDRIAHVLTRFIRSAVLYTNVLSIIFLCILILLILKQLLTQLIGSSFGEVCSTMAYLTSDKYIRIIKAFFTHTVSAVRVNGEVTGWFDVNSGTGQSIYRDHLSSTSEFLCNAISLYAESAYLMELNKVISKGALLQLPAPGVEEKHLLDTDYADDMAMLDNSKEGLQETTDLLCKYSAYAGLKINAGKTQSMAVSKSASQRPYSKDDTVDINVEGLPIQQVSSFTYLGAIISANGTIDKELSARIQKASGAFYQLSSIWYSRNIKTPTKIRIYKAAVLTILLYGSEVWNTTQTQMKRFEVFHHRCLRRILKIKWFYHVSNADVLKRANIAPVDTFV